MLKSHNPVKKEKVTINVKESPEIVQSSTNRQDDLNLDRRKPPINPVPAPRRKSLQPEDPSKDVHSSSEDSYQNSEDKLSSIQSEENPDDIAEEENKSSEAIGDESRDDFSKQQKEVSSEDSPEKSQQDSPESDNLKFEDEKNGVIVSNQKNENSDINQESRVSFMFHFCFI